MKCPKCGHIFQFQAPPSARSSKPSSGGAARPSTGQKKSGKKKVPPRAPVPPAPVPPAPAPTTPSAAPAAPAPPVTPAPRPPVAAPVVSQPPPASAPVAVAQPVVPTAQPVSTAPDPAWGFGSEPDATVAPPRSHVPRRARAWQKVLYMMVGLTVVGGLGFGGYKVLQALQEDKPTRRFVGNEEDDPTGYNFALSLPDLPWEQSRKAQLGLDVPLAMRRSGHASFMALDYEKYTRHVPGDPILIDKITRKMESYFKNMVWQPKPPATLDDLKRNQKVAGQPALVLEFEADMDGVVLGGEINLFTYRGIVYWLLTWAPLAQMAQAAPEWEEVRNGFKLLNGREGWSPQERPTQVTKTASFQLKYATEVWEKHKRPEEFDEQAEMVLIGHDPADRDKRVISAGKKGEVRILMLEKQDDLTAAAEAAKKRLSDNLQGEGFGKIDLTVVEDRQGNKKDGPAKIGPMNGFITQYRATIQGGTFDKLFLIGVLLRPQHTLVIRCDATWKRKTYWEQEFLALLKTIRPIE